MKVLIACEESQEVCKAFRAKGHEAYSCDLIEPSGGHPEWHILGDCLKAIEGGQVVTMDGTVHDVPRWDMIIAFVPCTKTSNAGARHLYKGGKLNLSRYYEGLCGKALFLAVWGRRSSTETSFPEASPNSSTEIWRVISSSGRMSAFQENAAP